MSHQKVTGEFPTAEPTQREKLEALQNDSYHRRAQSQPDDAGGRYARLSPTTVTGATPPPQFPKIPTGPWSGDDPAPTEEPLGYSVNDLEK